MNFMRELLAISIFVAGILLCITLFVEPFQWNILIFVILAFLAAYFIWPSKKRGQRQEDNIYLDVLEVIIEFPVEIILWLFRFLRLLSHKSDVDLDV